MEGFDVWIGKKVYVVLKTGRRYSGVVKDVIGEMITITDKFGEGVLFSVQDISSMEEER